MFGTKSIYALKQSLNGLSARQRVIAGNIANADTPGYKSLEVTFEDQLAGVLDKTVESGTGQNIRSAVVPRVFQAPSIEKPDGNTVDIDLEMANLAETSLRYEAASRLLSKKYAGLRLVITEGRR